MRLLSRLALGLLAAALPLAALAAAVLESQTGDVRVLAPDAKKPAAVQPGQRIRSGSTVITGADGQAILRFDDELKLALAPNSELGIVDYHYLPSAASADRAEFRLHRGALRVVTGLIARRNSEMFVVHTPHVNLGVRGTDFSVTIIGQSYWSVNDGAVAASTNAGKGVFGKGSYGRSASLDRLAAGVASAGLPVAVLALFHEINSPKLTAQLGPGPGGAMAAADPAPAQPAQTSVSAGSMMVILGVSAAALAAAAGGGDSGGATPATSH